MLLNTDAFINAVRNYRILYLDGRLGGGKTALAFRLAYELLMKYKYRYLLSNTLSVWNDDFSKVYLRNNIWLDGVLLFDEAGEFFEGRAQVKEALSFLRKINGIMLLPSFLPPARDVRILTVQRVYNLQMVGLPVWVYRWEIDKGSVTDGGMFFWVNPHEIYGIYDTLGMPSDAHDILQNLKNYVAQAATTLGYDKTAKKKQVISIFASEGLGLRASAASGAASDESTPNQTMDDLRGVVDTLYETTVRAQKAVSVSGKKSRGRRRS